MAHSHGHSHHSYHRSYYHSSGSWSWLEIIILVIILVAIISMQSCATNKVKEVWNGGYCLNDDTPYLYHQCEECGEIDSFRCETCGKFVEVAEGIRLDIPQEFGYNRVKETRR